MKKESNLLLHVNKTKNMNSIIGSKNLNVKRKKGRDLLEQPKKTDTKKKVKQQKVKKTREVKAKSNVSNVPLECNEEMFKCQMEQLESILKESLNCPTLTQEELRMLFIKYKLDGHYRTNMNLPVFTSLLNETCDNSNDKNLFYNQMQQLSVSHVQRLCNGNNKDESFNFYCTAGKENQYTDLEYNSCKSRNIFKPNDTCTDSTTTTGNNFNQATADYNTHTCNDINASNNFQEFNLSKYNINANNPSEMENALSSTEEYQNFKYVNTTSTCNISDSSIQNNGLNNHSEVLQKNKLHYSIEYNDLSLNPNSNYDQHANKWDNNVPLPSRSNDFETWKNMQLVCIQHTNKLDSHHNMNDSAFPYQLTLIKNHLEEQDSFHSLNHANMYSPMNNENCPYTSNSQNMTVQQNINTFNNTSPTVLSEVTNFLPELSTNVTSAANIIDQFNVTPH